MTPADVVRLRHMLHAVDAAARFIAGRSRSELDADQMLRFALVRAIDIDRDVLWATAVQSLPQLGAVLRVALGTRVGGP